MRRWSELEGCDSCILQRYVDRPFLLNDPAAGVVDAKFSFGVYASVTSVAPLRAWSPSSHTRARRTFYVFTGSRFHWSR